MIFSALDPALTQIMVEVLTVVIFVLVLHHLAALRAPIPRAVWIPDAIVSVIFGATVTLLILMSSTLSPEPILLRVLRGEGVPRRPTSGTSST